LTCHLETAQADRRPGAVGNAVGRGFPVDGILWAVTSIPRDGLSSGPVKRPILEGSQAGTDNGPDDMVIACPFPMMHGPDLARSARKPIYPARAWTYHG